MWDNINIALLIFGFIAFAFAWKNDDRKNADKFMVFLFTGLALWCAAALGAVVQWVFGWWG